MDTITTTPPLLVIIGETASGKSALALKLAQAFNGEIIVGDARTVYRGMDIGTAKPSTADRQLVPHHLLDIMNPYEVINASMFKELVLRKINDITERGALPILVGGSGLYVDSVLFDYEFRQPADLENRAELQDLSVADLQKQLAEQGIPLPRNSANSRHLVRSLETGGQIATKSPMRSNTCVLGLEISREQLTRNVIERVEAMFVAGLEKEVRDLVGRYGWDSQLSQTIGYKEFKSYFSGVITEDELKSLIVRDTLAYAKRQRTWFRRNKLINYICSQDESVALVTTWLNNSE